ncbi:sonic hedgehog protein A [Nylanderia fulva]|uniref:sonic hedgehog protein A n=1 Tax=Nylanderia fulva TaxID=613905 RepID=UPI0010FB8526|nr:sonic hedgehog protein A [Nylanderia fulva]
MVHYHHRRRGLQASHHCATRRRTCASFFHAFLLIFGIWQPVLENNGFVVACGPGRGGGRRPGIRKLTPLVFKQHVPNVSENTLPASGLSEGRMIRDDSRFNTLVPNYNVDIVFKDEEGSGADRFMTQRCKERLNTLAISVMNQWPGVKLRVTEAWDEEMKHATDSLHYEGRAVDVTTSDRDRSKYGMLARLAVEAGFDWVYYESRSHIHCSVKSESSSRGKSGGCFPGKSLVRTEDGVIKRLDEVHLGERIAALDSRGDVVYSEVIAFLDRAPSERRQFIRLTTASGRVLTLTPAHLVPVEKRSSIFAARVQPGDRILVSDTAANNHTDSRLRWDNVVEAKLVLEEGVFAPLTTEGTVIVDDVVASCYAVVDSQLIAHYAFLPLRIWNTIASFFVQRLDSAPHVRGETEDSQPAKEGGVHWYASMLYSMSTYILSPKMLYN